MEFQHYDLGKLAQGAVVEIVLSGEAPRVLLLDDENFANYKYKRNYRYFGGPAKDPSIRIMVPRTDYWHVVIDFSGKPVLAETSVKVRTPASKKAQAWV